MPNDYVRAPLMMLLLILAGGADAQPLLRITSPAEGTIVRPGQVVKVTVKAEGSLRAIGLIGTGQLAADPITSAPYDFNLSIPAGLSPGLRRVTAVGYESPGKMIYSLPLTIDVERADEPQKLIVEPSSLDVLKVGESVALGVRGLFADGTKSELNASTRTRYATGDVRIVRISADGVVEAVGEGATKVTVVHGRSKAELRVFVERETKP